MQTSVLGSGSVRTPQVSEAGPVQPAGVRQAARVSFNLPASPSPVDPDAEEEEEARDLVVSTPAVQDKTLMSCQLYL